MFSVPGWAISASSLVQEPTRSKKISSVSESSSLTNKSKKRKQIEGKAIAEHTRHGSTGHAIPPSPRETASSPYDPQASRHIAETGKARVKRHEADQRPQPHKKIKISNAVQSNDVAASTQQSQKKHESLKTNRIGKKHHVKEQDLIPGVSDRSTVPTQVSQSTSNMTLTPLQAKMRSKLTSARFRHLNQTLYTTSSNDALQLFTSSPDLFADYHAGFAQQVKESWPQNPVDKYIQSVKTRGAASPDSPSDLNLPRRKTGSCTIADLGCGDAPLARGCQSVIRTLKLKFHNYDLHASNSMVTKADISNLPLRDGEADVAVFCLSLMGTNWISFVEESWRILRGDGKGEVWVAEVKSRFGRASKGRVVENSVGKRRKQQKSRVTDNGDDNGYNEPEQFVEDGRAGDEPDDETDISAFVKVFTRRGFQLRSDSVYKRNKMFVSMIFTKTGIPTAGKHKGLKWTGREYQKQPDGKTRFANGQRDEEEMTPEQEAKVLKPCVYKTR